MLSCTSWCSCEAEVYYRGVDRTDTFFRCSNQKLTPVVPIVERMLILGGSSEREVDFPLGICVNQKLVIPSGVHVNQKLAIPFDVCVNQKIAIHLGVRLNQKLALSFDVCWRK